METMTPILITFIAQFVGFWICAYFGNKEEVIRREIENEDMLAIKLKISVFVLLFSNLIISLFLLFISYSLIFFITGIFTVITSHIVAYLQLKKLYKKSRKEIR